MVRSVRVVVAFAAVVLVGLAVHVFAQARNPTVLSASVPGRYVMLAPPQAATEAKNNFLWVLDTQTGAVQGYRFASIQDKETKAVLAWGTEPLAMFPSSSIAGAVATRPN